jgi:tRNA A-37 threonylcarbamoyl transferase component Bud32
MVPAGYERLLLGHAIAVARSDLALNIRQSLVSADGTKYTLHEYASNHAASRPLKGRGTAYAVPLPQTTVRVVVRHNRHGGLLASLTGDRFFSPTRAPYELETSLQLQRLGVPTPDIVAYALYPPGGVLQRSDVCTREIPGSRDLADILRHDDGAARTNALAATARLVGALARAGARHHDLNAKNVLLTADNVYVLDVDRVTLGGQLSQVLDGNLARLARSLKKWREKFGAHVTESDIAMLDAEARRAVQSG